jgi:hypothetical protein
MAISQRDKDLETEAATQSHYIKWERIMWIPDPCGPNVGYQSIAAIYIKYLVSRVNYYNESNLHSATLCGYATAMNMLFELRKYRPPINFNDNHNIAGVIISNIMKEENIAIQQTPLDNSIFAEIQQSACESSNPTQITASSPIQSFSVNGPQVSKYAQTTQLKVNYHTYPSGC